MIGLAQEPLAIEILLSRQLRPPGIKREAITRCSLGRAHLSQKETVGGTLKDHRSEHSRTAGGLRWE
jgi:hypothetical protein